MTNSFYENQTISPEFIQQIRDFLEHLYDFPYQQRHTLVLTPADTGYAVVEIAGPKARKLLLDALEKIGEEKSLAFRSSQARLYNILRLHYIEGMPINDVARELGLSPRQTYRDLRSASEVIASIVWTHLIKQISGTEAPPVSAAATEATTAAAESTEQQPSLQFQPANLNELVTTICDTVRPLAASHAVELKLALPDLPVIVPTDGMVARQVITGLLSLAIRIARSHPLEIALSTNGRECLLRFSFRPADPVSGAVSEIADPSIGLYAQNLGWQISQQVNTDQEVEIRVSMQTHLRTCLIIDDNPGFVELLERYVDNSVIYITTAENGLKGIEIARQLQPDVIILDVMIPEMDGWQVLQHLHSAPATKTIPIIICSVFYDPDLALTLGAADVLKKPVRKEDLISALKNLNIL